MASPTDHELIAEIRAGRRNALGALFDRYSPALYEFIYLVIGDRDQAARILEDVFMRVPSAVPTLEEGDSVRGWLYGLARELSLNYLRQKGWLDALPPSDEPSVAGLPGDIWRSARAMPAFLRAVLVVEELHGLSPTEKAHALNVVRTDLPRLVDEARRAFNLQFDLQARQQGRPLASQVDPERIWGIHRRLGVEGSLFGYLPVVVLPDSLADALRAKILNAPRGQPVIQETVPAAITEEVEEVEEPVSLVPLPPRAEVLPEGCTPSVLLTALLIAALITALAACLGYVFLVRDSTPPLITRIDPPDQSVIPPTLGAATTRVIISVIYSDDRAIDQKSIRLILDGQDVTSQALISGTSLSYPVDLNSGLHNVVFQVRDTSNNLTTRAWQFTVGPQPGVTPTPTATPTLIFTPTITPTPSATATGTLPPPPVINSFTSNQTNVAPGTPVLLSWSVAGASVVFLNQDRVDLNGSRLVSPTTTTTYHLIANSAGGTTDRTLTIVVQGLPDLIVPDVSVNPAGQVVYVIRNVGNADVTQMFLIQVFADGLPIDSNRRVASLPAGQEVSLFVPNYTLVGTHVITVRVNATQEVQESNYNNNELTRTLNGLAPTLTFTPTFPPTLTPTPTLPPTSTPTSTPTLVPTNTPTATTTPYVSSVSATLVTGSPYTGACPGNFQFTGVITVTGPTTVTYRWERTDGTTVPSLPIPYSYTFTSAGSLTITDNWNSAPAGIWGERVHILQPNDTYSNQATFQNNCH